MEEKKNTLEIIRLTPAEVARAQELFALFRDVFEIEEETGASDTHIGKLLAKPDFMAFVAVLDDTVVGGLTAHELLYVHADQSEAFIYDIAIDPKQQRKGIGRQLLQALQQHCIEKGIGTIFVDAVADEQHAVDFYTSTGGESVKVIQFTYPVNRGT